VNEKKTRQKVIEGGACLLEALGGRGIAMITIWVVLKGKTLICLCCAYDISLWGEPKSGKGILDILPERHGRGEKIGVTSAPGM
jgi:hypothetical protein